MDGVPIRVLCTAFAPVPGSSPHASALLGMAAAIRGELDLITIKTESLSHMEHHGDARLYRVPVGLGSAREQRETFGRACVRQLESQPYDVVHVRGPLEGRLLAERKKANHFRFVYEVATFPDEAEGADTETAWERAHLECAEAADLILVPSSAAARSLGDQGHAGKVAVVHPGVDVNTYDWWPAGSGETARLLYLGGLAADRDLGTVLAAVKIVARERPVEVLVAGEPDADLRERVRRVVTGFELDKVVTVRGEPRAIALPMIIGASDICLAPASAAPRFQDYGDIPQPLLEYVACRRPVIAAAVPGVAEILRDDKEGVLYAPGDHESLAESLVTLLDNHTLRERLVEAAYDRARWQFSDGARRRRIAEVYEMLAPGSQLYDAWSEGFYRDHTGAVAVPSDGFELSEDDFVDEDSGGFATPEVIAPPSDEGEILYVPGETSEVGLPAATARMPQEDTSPRTPLPEEDEVEDLMSVPTEIVRTPTEVTKPDTDRHDKPEGREPDTGPVHTPESR
jgi:glycosyltransferase involved in cell wall biosynthesis